MGLIDEKSDVAPKKNNTGLVEGETEIIFKSFLAIFLLPKDLKKQVNKTWHAIKYSINEILLFWMNN